METKEELIERIIKEQDLACFYVVNTYNSSLDLLEYYSEDNNVMYSDIDKFILDNPQILDRLSTKNLMNLLAVTCEEEQKEKLVAIITERLKTEDLFCEDIDDSSFMKLVHSSDRAINKIGNKNIETAIAQIHERIAKIENPRAQKIADSLIYIIDAVNFLEYYEQGIFDEKKIDFLEKMLAKDKDALRYVNFAIFRDDIFELGPDFIEYLSKFTAMSAQVVIIANHNPELMKVLREQFDKYENLPDNFNEIATLITYFAKKCFKIEVSKDTNVDELIDSAFRESNTFNASVIDKTVKPSFGENYKKRLEAEYQDRYRNTTNIGRKLSIYLEKVFSLSLQGAKKFLDEYGADIENLEGLDEEKELVSKLKEDVRLDSEEEIDKLFSEAVNLYSPSQIFKFTQNLAKACAKSYITEMNSTDEHIQELEIENGQDIEFNGHKIKQIRLTGKFYMLLHSTDTGFIEDTEELAEETNFPKSWNSGKNKENHIISTTMVNEDFLGTSPVGTNGVRYGFTDIPENSIQLMGVTDLNTFSTNFSYSANNKKYMSAKTLPYSSRRVYSEFGIEREGIVPDYVVIFDDDLEEVKNNAYQAAGQFDIPVVFIDKGEIEQQQIGNLRELITRIEKEGNIADVKNLINCYETNRAGWLLNRNKEEKDGSFTSSIDNSRFEQDFDEMGAEIEGVVREYLSSVTEREEGSIQELTGIMGILLKEIELYKDCDKTKPISKTQISFDAYGLVQDVNEALNKVGGNEYTVNVEELPDVETYRLTIKQLIANALTGNDAVNIEDVSQAMKIMELAQEREGGQYDK